MDPNRATNIGRYNPMPKYSNLLATATDIQSAQQAQQMNALKMQKDMEAAQQAQIQNQLIAQNINPDTGELNIGAATGALAARGMGSAALGLAEKGLFLDVKRLTGKKTEAETRKTTIEADRAEMTAAAQALVNVGDQASYDQWRRVHGKNADAFPAQYNPQVVEGIRRSMLSLDKQMEMAIQQINRGGQIDVVGINKYTGRQTPLGQYADVPLPPDVQAQRERTAPQTTVSVGDQAAQKVSVDYLFNRLKSLESAPAFISSLRQAKELVPTAVTGRGASLLTNVANFTRNRFGFDIAPGTVDSETLRSLLFRGVLDNLRQLDAQPTQQQQIALQQALGTIDTDPQALVRIIDIWDDIVTSNVERHNVRVNEAVKSGIQFPFSPTVTLPEKTGGAPKVGEIRKGYRFKGGDPGNQNNWEKVQ